MCAKQNIELFVHIVAKHWGHKKWQIHAHGEPACRQRPQIYLQGWTLFLLGHIEVQCFPVIGKTASKLWKMRQLSGNAVSAVHPMWIQAWRMGSISSYCEAMLSLPFSMWTPHPHHWWGEFLPCPLKTLLAEHVNSMTSKTIPSVLQVASRPWPWRQCVRQLGMHAMHSPLAVNYANRIVRTSGVWCSLRVFYGSYKCVCVDQIAATWHLALAPIRVVSHSEELVLVQNLYQLTLFVNILSHNACIMIQILYDHMDRIS